MKSQIIYNKKIAKSFRDTKYYENTEFYDKSLELVMKEEKELKTYKINEALYKVKDFNLGNVLEILKKN
jgi:hypothetical protein